MSVISGANPLVRIGGSRGKEGVTIFRENVIFFKIFIISFLVSMSRNLDSFKFWPYNQFKGRHGTLSIENCERRPLCLCSDRICCNRGGGEQRGVLHLVGEHHITDRQPAINMGATVCLPYPLPIHALISYNG